MADVFGLADELGPAKVVHVQEPRLGLRAIVVVDNVACGPAIGGVRMAPDVTVQEVCRLARAMTLKNAAAGLRHGGGKAAILADPMLPLPEKERLVRGFARAVRDLTDYIPGPDMGTNETCMGWVHDEIGRCIGLPRELGGIPLDEIGVTAFGVVTAAEVACAHLQLRLQGARVAIQGFGAVGHHAARLLAERGATIVAVSDISGMVHREGGLDVAALLEHQRRGELLACFKGADHADRDAIVDVPCEIWIPAARPDVIHEGNGDRLQARLVVCGANIPLTAGAERSLHARGVLVVPDFIANAGGVICGAVELRGGTQGQALATIAETIRANTQAVLDAATAAGTTPRDAAEALAVQRVRRAMQLRRTG